VGSIEIDGRNGERLFSAQLGGEGLTLWGDQPLGPSGQGYQWRDVHDLAAEGAAAAQAAQQQQEVAQAQQTQRAENDRRATEGMNSFFSTVKTLLVLALLIWLFTKRESILRWFYSLTPHPAKGQVDAAIHSGAPIDGALYRQVIDATYGGTIENEVRSEQANELTARLRRHEAALRSEEVKIVDAARREAARNAAFLRAHLELLRAGVSHEDAAARLDELKRMTRK
jgi:hypothetical protein